MCLFPANNNLGHYQRRLKLLSRVFLSHPISDIFEAIRSSSIQYGMALNFFLHQMYLFRERNKVNASGFICSRAFLGKYSRNIHCKGIVTDLNKGIARERSQGGGEIRFVTAAISFEQVNNLMKNS